MEQQVKHGAEHVPDDLEVLDTLSLNNSGDSEGICNKKQTEGIIHFEKVQVGKDQEKAQSEKDSHSKTEVGKTKLTIRHLYHETYRKPNEQLFSQ